jgi:hypothetical protein
MLKKQYMLTGVFERVCTHEGVRIIKNETGTIVTEYIPILFKPREIVWVRADIDMSKAVEAGFIREIKAVCNDVQNKVVEPKKNEDNTRDIEAVDVKKNVENVSEDMIINDGTNNIRVSIPLDDIIENDSQENDSQEDDETIVEPLEVIEEKEEIKDEEQNYIELEDGTFKCLICEKDGVEKIFKSSKWLFNHMEKHIL